MVKDSGEKPVAGEKERIAKVMARAGLCSRRDAERWIAEGRVSVNGAVLATPAVTVGPDDRVTVDGRALPQAEKPRLFLYHKPPGLVTTARDEKGRATVFDNLPPGLPRVVSVGRLDLNSEGLLLLTNDGGLARYLELPATGWKRRYRVRVHGAPDPARLKALSSGITVEGIHYKGIEASIDASQKTPGEGKAPGSNTWLSVTLTEGKNREIRKVMVALGYSVNRLIRLSFGPFQLGLLARGEVREVPGKAMREQVAGYFKSDVRTATGTAGGGNRARNKNAGKGKKQ